MKNILSGIFDLNNMKINSLNKRVQKILSMDEVMQKLTDDELKAKATEFKNRLDNGETLDDILDEAYAVAREASYRVLGMKHFPVQVMGGIVLHEGNIAEMKTGEGKTLVSTLPAYLNALTGKGVYIVTVNEYLANRDREEMGKVHEFLGLTVGITQREMSLEQKKAAYNCDITYGTNSEFGFDYLRDNMAITKDRVVQRGLNYAIIDEVDSILIDEARTPLIISGQGKLSAQFYITVDRFVKSLKGEDYHIDNEKQIAELTDSGMDKVEKIFGVKNISETGNVELLHYIRQSLHASYVMKKDQDYVIKDGEVIIVDKFTGRLMPGRRYSEGLHQAIEAKENVEIQKESSTLATITYQNYFKMFSKISGMTGTAYTEKEEFKSIYSMDVVVIPTNKPLLRMDKDDLIFRTEEEKLNAIINEIEGRYKKGQPVLVGTIYIDKSELVSQLLDKRGIPHRVLNAKQDKDEAEIVALAGQKGAITISTNMAGRGTDIKLGDGVSELGGLLVIGTERHESRRIDNQLRGRSGRQGDPGESLFYISLEDTIFKKLDKERMKKLDNILIKGGYIENEPIHDKILNKAIENVQKNIEGINYGIRINTLEYDTILNEQRLNIYRERNRILDGEDMSDLIKQMMQDATNDVFERYSKDSKYPQEWDFKGLEAYLANNLGLKRYPKYTEMEAKKVLQLSCESIKNDILQCIMEQYEEREKILGETRMRFAERFILMKAIDRKWIDHLDVLTQVKQGVSLQALGNKKPIMVFNEEAYNLFDEMMNDIKLETIRFVINLAIKAEVDKDESDNKPSKE